MQRVEIKKLCPMIAVISAGKTSILKTIFDIDFLEVSSGVGTKFVNIIRYNKSVGKEPIFYHLKLEKTENGYEFYKDPNSVIIGKENIKKKNKEINELLKAKNQVSYQDLFYMVEIGQTNLIEDEEYLNNYDLVDIPGVSEYSSQKKLDKNLEDELNLKRIDSQFPYDADSPEIMYQKNY
jgi:hypothetical protein